jgi:hypothetical protein
MLTLGGLDIELILTVCFATENLSFCDLILSFFSSRVLVTVLKKDKIRVQNVEFAGKRKNQDEFILLLI